MPLAKSCCDTNSNCGDCNDDCCNEWNGWTIAILVIAIVLVLLLLYMVYRSSRQSAAVMVETPSAAVDAGLAQAADAQVLPPQFTTTSELPGVVTTMNGPASASHMNAPIKAKLDRVHANTQRAFEDADAVQRKFDEFMAQMHRTQ